jgi:curved DNA-binding protein CbpA
MASHYDTLGVPPTATDAEIRAAYQRAASRAHPDRQGGNVERMANVNTAYRVLSERRAEYDAGEGDDEPPSVERRAEQAFMTMFAAALGSTNNPVNAIWEQLSAQRHGVQAHITQARIAQRALEKRAEGLRYKGKGRDLMRAVVDQRLQAYDRTIAEGKEALTIMNLVETLLKDYESEEPLAGIAQPNASYQWWSGR